MPVVKGGAGIDDCNVDAVPVVNAVLEVEVLCA